jgi:hypothetical protein
VTVNVWEGPAPKTGRCFENPALLRATSVLSDDDTFPQGMQTRITTVVTPLFSLWLWEKRAMRQE